MGDKTKHLVRVGHEFAAAMSDDTPIITIAKMVTELASALDVQSTRSDALAAELARYSMPAGEADQRMAESRAVRQALGFGQDADDVAPVDLVERINALAEALKSSEANDADARCHVAELEAKCAALAAENAALIGFDADEFSYNGPYQPDDAVLEKLKTPATDAWVNEQRAVGAEMCVKALVTSDDDSFEDAPNICANVAAQLRGSESVPVERLLLNKLQEGRS
ncbi:hypothetical protein [Atlantibacter hermannii]|uniref:hypothetical protein n=1 Tax=Atlantibacter hermannii TaxID=565 RepID=UPI0028AF518F|nr:hypothetical protein [Atlantibacter hermannii]